MAERSLGSVVVAIKAVDEASSVFGKIQASLGVLGGSLSQLGGGFQSVGSIISGFAGAGVVGAVSAGVGEVIKSLQWATSEAAESEQAWKDLQAALKLTGPAWDEARKGVEALAGTLQRTTTFSDEQVVGAIQRLTTFGMDYKQAMEAVRVAIDLAAAKHLDLQTAADLLGKTFSGNTSILARYGVNIDSIKESMGKGATDAQIYEGVLAKLNEQFGGTAAEQAKTYAGAQERLKNAMSDMGEKIGGIVIPALASFTEAMIPVVEWLTESIGKVQDWIAAVAKMPEVKAATDALGQAFAGLQEWFGKVATAMAETLGPAFQELFDALREVWDAVQPLFEAFGELWNAIAGGEGTGNAFKDLLGLIAVNIKAVAFLIKQLVPIIRTIADAFKDAADFIAPVLTTIVNAVSGFFQALRAAFQGFYDWLVGASLWTDLWTNMQTVAQQAIVGLISMLTTQLLEPLRNAFANTLGAIQQVIIDAFTNAATYVTENFPVLVKAITVAMADLQDMWMKAWEAISQIPADLLAKAASFISTSLGDFTAAFKLALTEAFDYFKKTWDTVWEGLKATAKGIWDAIVAFAQSAISQFMFEFNKLPGFFSELGGRLRSALDGVMSRIREAMEGLINWAQEKLQGFWNWISGHSMWPEMWNQVLQQTQAATADIADTLVAGTQDWTRALGGFSPEPAVVPATAAAPTLVAGAAGITPAAREALTIPINVYLDGQQIAAFLERRVVESLQPGRSKRTTV